jgi:hypothetical protein
MVDKYTIYLENKSASEQTFWCFLAAPEGLAADPTVFANSSASLTVEPNYPGTNQFVIPVQYSIGAGASNKAVGLSVQINADAKQNVDLLSVWDAKYFTIPPKKGPILSQNKASKSPADTIRLVSNNFDRVKNDELEWYSNMSFGIKTESGFMGMTWAPNPEQTRTIKPILKFYVSTGDFGENQLAKWNDVSNKAAEIQVPRDFKNSSCTVTYTSRGEWEVKAGRPFVADLVQGVSYFLARAEDELIARSAIAMGVEAKNKDSLESVEWDRPALDWSAENTYLSGTITVATALVASFAYFVLSGIQFNIDREGAGGTTFHFVYNGTVAAKTIQDLFVAGAELYFGGRGETVSVA